MLSDSFIFQGHLRPSYSFLLVLTVNYHQLRLGLIWNHWRIPRIPNTHIGLDQHAYLVKILVLYTKVVWQLHKYTSTSLRQHRKLRCLLPKATTVILLRGSALFIRAPQHKYLLLTGAHLPKLFRSAGKSKFRRFDVYEHIEYVCSNRILRLSSLAVDSLHCRNNYVLYIFS